MGWVYPHIATFDPGMHAFKILWTKMFESVLEEIDPWSFRRGEVAHFFLGGSNHTNTWNLFVLCFGGWTLPKKVEIPINTRVMWVPGIRYMVILRDFSYDSALFGLVAYDDPMVWLRKNWLDHEQDSQTKSVFHPADTSLSSDHLLYK